MQKYYYIATPYGDLEEPHWRLLEAEIGGAETIVFSLRLRGLAAKSNRGGLVCLHTGEPMSMSQICTFMGYSIQLVQRSLELLHRHGLAQPGDGGVVVTDPLLLQHFGRVALPAPTAGKPGRKPSPSAKTGAERQRDFRQRHKKSNGNSNGITPDNSVTPATQHTDIADDSRRNKNIQIEVNTIRTNNNPVVAVVDSEIIKILNPLPVHEWHGLAPYVLSALETGHTTKVVADAITAAKAKSSRPCGEAGLAIKLLRSLIACPPPPVTASPPQPPPPPYDIPADSPTNAEDFFCYVNNLS